MRKLNRETPITPYLVIILKTVLSCTVGTDTALRLYLTLLELELQLVSADFGVVEASYHINGGDAELTNRILIMLIVKSTPVRELQIQIEIKG